MLLAQPPAATPWLLGIPSLLPATTFRDPGWSPPTHGTRSNFGTCSRLMETLRRAELRHCHLPPRRPLGSQLQVRPSPAPLLLQPLCWTIVLGGGEMSEPPERGVLPPQTHHSRHLEPLPSPPLLPHPASANLEAGPTVWCPGGSLPLGPTQAIVLLLKDEG